MASPLHFEAPTALQYFSALVAEDDGFALLEAAVSVAQDEYPGLDPQSVLSQLDALADRLRKRIAPDTAPLQRLRLLNRYCWSGPAISASHSRLHLCWVCSHWAQCATASCMFPMPRNWRIAGPASPCA